jgi:hypothetical protein
MRRNSIILFKPLAFMQNHSVKRRWLCTKAIEMNYALSTTPSYTKIYA